MSPSIEADLQRGFTLRQGLPHFSGEDGPTDRLPVDLAVVQLAVEVARRLGDGSANENPNDDGLLDHEVTVRLGTVFGHDAVSLWEDGPTILISEDRSPWVQLRALLEVLEHHHGIGAA